MLLVLILLWQSIRVFSECPCSDNQYCSENECLECNSINLVPNTEKNGCTYAWLKQSPDLTCEKEDNHRQCLDIVSQQYQCEKTPSYTDGYINNEKCEIFKKCTISPPYKVEQDIYFTEYGFRYINGQSATLNISCVIGTSGTIATDQQCNETSDFAFSGCLPNLNKIQSISTSANTSLQTAGFVVKKEDFEYLNGNNKVFSEVCQTPNAYDDLCSIKPSTFECAPGYSNLYLHNGKFRRKKLMITNSDISSDGVLTQITPSGCLELSQGNSFALTIQETTLLNDVNVGAIFLESDSLNVTTTTIETESFQSNENNIRVQYTLYDNGEFTYETQSELSIACPYKQPGFATLYSTPAHRYFSKTNHSCILEECPQVQLEDGYLWSKSRILYGHDAIENTDTIICDTDNDFTFYHFDGSQLWKNAVQTGTHTCENYDLAGCYNPTGTFQVDFNSGYALFPNLATVPKLTNAEQALNNTITMKAEIICDEGRSGGLPTAQVTWQREKVIVWDEMPCQECGSTQENIRATPIQIAEKNVGDYVCEPTLDESNYQVLNVFAHVVREAHVSYEDYTFECQKQTNQTDCTRASYRDCKEKENTNDCSKKSFCQWKQATQKREASEPCQKRYVTCSLEHAHYQAIINGQIKNQFNIETDNAVVECAPGYTKMDVQKDNDGDPKVFFERFLSPACIRSRKIDFICVPQCQLSEKADYLKSYNPSYDAKIPLYYDVGDTTLVLKDWPINAQLNDFRPVGPNTAWVHYLTYESADLKHPQTDNTYLQFYYKNGWPLADNTGKEAERINDYEWGDCLSITNAQSNYIHDNSFNSTANVKCNTIGNNGMTAFSACISCGGGMPVPAKETRDCGYKLFNNSDCANYLPGRNWTNNSEQIQHCQNALCQAPQQDIRGYTLNGTTSNLTFSNVNLPSFQPYECDSRAYFGTADTTCKAAGYPIRLSGCHPKWCLKKQDESISYKGFNADNNPLFMPNWQGALDEDLPGKIHVTCADTHYLPFEHRDSTPTIEVCAQNNTELNILTNNCEAIPSDACTVPSDMTAYSKTGDQPNKVFNRFEDTYTFYKEDLRIYRHFGVENWTCAQDYGVPIYYGSEIVVEICENNSQPFDIYGCIPDLECQVPNNGNGYIQNTNRDIKNSDVTKDGDDGTYRQNPMDFSSIVSTLQWRESDEKIKYYTIRSSGILNIDIIMTWVCDKGYEGSAIASHCTTTNVPYELSGCVECKSGYYKPDVINGDTCIPWKPTCPSGEGYTPGNTTHDRTCSPCGEGEWKNGINNQSCQLKTTSCADNNTILFESGVSTHDNKCCHPNSEVLSALNGYMCSCSIKATPNGPLEYDGFNSYYEVPLANGQKTCRQWSPCPRGEGRLTWGNITHDGSCETCNASDYKYSQENDFTACQDHTTCPPGKGVKKINGQHVFLNNLATVCEDCQADVNYSSADSYLTCEAVQECDYDIQYHIPGNITHDRICKTLDTCDYTTQYENVSATRTVNRVCDNIRHCEGKDLYNSANNITLLWKYSDVNAIQNHGNTFMVTDYTRTSNRVCQPLTKCTYGDDFTISDFQYCRTNYFKNENGTYIPQNDEIERFLAVAGICQDGKMNNESPRHGSTYSYKKLIPSDYPLGTYETVAPQWNETEQMYIADRQCANITDCKAYEYEIIEPFWNRDRQCTNRTICSLSEYETIAPTKKINRQCANITKCLGDEYESAAMHHYTDEVGLFQYNSDRICLKLRKCNFDLEYETVEPQWDENQQMYVTNRQCKNLTICNNEIEYISTNKTNTSDRACSPRQVECNYGERINLGNVYSDTICTACPEGKISRGIHNAECRCIQPLLEKSDGTCHETCEKNVVTTSLNNNRREINFKEAYENSIVQFNASEMNRPYYKKINTTNLKNKVCSAFQTFGYNYDDSEDAIVTDCVQKCLEANTGQNRLKGLQIKYIANGRECECVSEFATLDNCQTFYRFIDEQHPNGADVVHYDFHTSVETYSQCLITGCKNSSACNYEPSADISDENTCIFPNTYEWPWCTCDYRPFYNNVNRLVGYVYKDGSATCDAPDETDDIQMYGYVRRKNSQNQCVDECASWSGSLESGFHQRINVVRWGGGRGQYIYAYEQKIIQTEHDATICNALDQDRPIVSHDCLGLAISKPIENTYCASSSGNCQVPQDCSYSGGQCITCDMDEMTSDKIDNREIDSPKIYIQYPGTYDVELFGDFNYTSYTRTKILWPLYKYGNDSAYWTIENVTAAVTTKIYSTETTDSETYGDIIENAKGNVSFSMHKNNDIETFDSKTYIKLQKKYPNNIYKYGRYTNGRAINHDWNTYESSFDSSAERNQFRNKATVKFRETGTSFKICRRGCTLTTPPEHGSLGDCEGQTLAPGDTCLPECDAGYMPDRRTMCSYDGLQETTCIAEDVCVVTAPANGNMGDCPGTLLSDQTCKPACNEGFVRQGVTTCNDGEVSVASCVAIPNVYLYGYVVRQQSDQTCKAECVRWRGTLDDDFDEPATGNGAAIIESVTDASSCAELQTQDIHHSEDCPKSSCVLQNPTGDCTHTMSSGTTCQPCQTATHATKIWCASGTVTRGEDCSTCPDGQFERVAGDLATCTTCSDVTAWYNSNCHRQCNGECETYKQAYNIHCVCL